MKFLVILSATHENSLGANYARRWIACENKNNWVALVEETTNLPYNFFVYKKWVEADSGSQAIAKFRQWQNGVVLKSH